MEAKDHHEDIIGGISAQLKDVLDGSEQAVYIYMDDNHNLCNRKFARMLGFGSPGEFAALKDPLAATVSEKSQKAVVDAYTTAVERKSATAMKATLKHRSGRTFEAELIMVPIAYQGHTLALHFLQI